MAYGSDSYKNMAVRIANAHADFNATIRNISGCSEADAEKVVTFYLKNKIAKLDAGIGRISVKHGAFLGSDVILRAIEQA